MLFRSNKDLEYLLRAQNTGIRAAKISPVSHNLNILQYKKTYGGSQADIKKTM